MNYLNNLSRLFFNFQAQKPRIEKLRRDRINGSLDEIKHLVLEALNKDVSTHRCNSDRLDLKKRD